MIIYSPKIGFPVSFTTDGVYIVKVEHNRLQGEVQTIRQAIRQSIDANGIQATGEHWAAVMDTIGPVPKLYLDTIEVIFNQEVSECF